MTNPPFPKRRRGICHLSLIICHFGETLLAEFDLHHKDGSRKNKRHGIRDNHRPGMNEYSIDQPQSNASTKHQVHAEADVFRTSMLQRSQHLGKISNGGQRSGDVPDDGSGCGHAVSLPHHRWTRPEASPFSSALTSSTLERVKSPGIECFRQLAATANSRASCGAGSCSIP
jgi:hypothetical protein